MKPMVYRFTYRIDATAREIESDELGGVARYATTKSIPIGETTSVDGDLDEIKETICRKIDLIAAELDRWFQEHEGAHE